MTSLHSMIGARDFAIHLPAWLATPQICPSFPHAIQIEYSAARTLVQPLFARRAELNNQPL
jgi:hypothetical protein